MSRLLKSVLPISRRAGVIAVAIPVPDLSVLTVDEEFTLVGLSDPPTCCLGGTLGTVVGDGGRKPLLLHCPTIPRRDHMNVLTSHSVPFACNGASLDVDRPIGLWGLTSHKMWCVRPRILRPGSVLVRPKSRLLGTYVGHTLHI
jgi:hypothetical protein